MTEEEYSLWRTVYVTVYVTALENKYSSDQAHKKANAAVRHYRENVKPPAMSDEDLKRQML